MTIRVLVAEDQPLMRTALRDCLETDPGIEVVAEAGNGEQAVELARTSAPDVALVDIRMPVMDGIEATRLIVDGGVHAPRVIVMTTFDLDEYIVSALRAGASGFLLKDATAEELMHAVRTVAAGDALLAPGVTRRLLDSYARFLPAPSHGTPATDLTPRELDVLKLVARGQTNAQIAAGLYVAESSVKTHVGHLLVKLRVRDRVHLVIHAYESGLVRPGSLRAETAEVSESVGPVESVE
ncbi:response regulator [Terrabacter sp. 2RAF25]|uniref:response regulator n=1 Tax=Terrabacter sp. 2RAF25 TaxID=3232998 RepID=UPI003F9958A0